MVVWLYVEGVIEHRWFMEGLRVVDTKEKRRKCTIMLNMIN